MNSLFSLFCLMPTLASAEDVRPPNIVLILADDLGYGDLGCYGAEDIRTPQIDRLADQGVRFTDFYSNGPECSPTRTALFTGRYQQRVGGLECAIGTGNVGRYDDAIRLRETHDLGLPVAESCLPRLLNEQGYVSACLGKWHLGYEEKFLPLEHGFDYAFGPLGGGVDYFHHTEWDGTHVLRLNDKPVHREGYLTDLITNEAVAFLRRAHEKPFFLYVPYTAPHTPYQGPEDRQDQPILKDTWNEGDRATYAKMVERLDHGVGVILQSLRAAGVEERTIVIFASDNGPTRIGSSGPFSGTKSTLHEGGIHVPCIIRWPKMLPAGQLTAIPTLTLDLTASIVRIAGARPPADRPFDGIDVVRVLQQRRPPPHRALFWRSRRADRTWRAVRSGHLKYLSRQDGDPLEEHLFDLKQDPGETTDLLAERAEDGARLKRLLREWEAEVRPSR